MNPQDVYSKWRKEKGLSSANVVEGLKGGLRRIKEVRKLVIMRLQLQRKETQLYTSIEEEIDYKPAMRQRSSVWRW